MSNQMNGYDAIYILIAKAPIWISMVILEIELIFMFLTNDNNRIQSQNKKTIPPNLLLYSSFFSNRMQILFLVCCL